MTGVVVTWSPKETMHSCKENFKESIAVDKLETLEIEMKSNW